MKNLFVAALATVAFSSPLFGENSADVLMWDVDTTKDLAAYDGATRAFDSIKFWAIDPDGGANIDLTSITYYDGPDYLLNKDSEYVVGDGSGYIRNQNGTTTFDGTFYTDLTGLSSDWTFMAELYRDGQSIDRMLVPLTWNDIAAGLIRNYSGDSDLNPISVQPYNMASTMVPEPTSGLLLVIGGALLALRRRRVA